MTTIAYDGKTLAVDSRISDNQDTITSERGKKLFKVGDKWIAFSGDWQDAMLALDWFRAGEPKDKKPQLDNLTAFVKIGSRCYRYEKKLARWEVKAPAATGSGYEFALAAMACGKTARQAIQLAAKFNLTTNSRIQATP